MITVVGLGILENQITLEGAEAVKSADKVFVKTALTPTYKYFENKGVAAESFDGVFETAENFDELDEKIIERLVKEGESKNVAFCVNGDGASDGTAAKLLERKEGVRLVPGISVAAVARAFAPSTSGAEYAASDVVAKSDFSTDKRVPLTIREIDDKFMASEVKEKLADCYGYGETCYILKTKNGKIVSEKITVDDIDKGDGFDCSTAVILPPTDLLKSERYGFYDLLQIMDRLLAEDGCPWDRAQTHKSIRKSLIEEAYELCDAISEDDLENMVEETGDVMLQAVFHGKLGEKDGEFDVADTITGLCKKLISRHTHVFGDVKVSTGEEALKVWEQNKAVEKKTETASQKIDKIAKSLPSLSYAEKVLKYAAKDGFEWTQDDSYYDKVAEELNELRTASPEDAEMEAGDLLLSVLNPLRHLHINPEVALRVATQKFINRFKHVQAAMTRDGLKIDDPEVFDRYWDEAKKVYR